MVKSPEPNIGVGGEESHNSVVPAEVPVPDEVKQLIDKSPEVKQFMMSIAAFFESGNPFSRKLTPDHITDMIAAEKEAGRRNYFSDIWDRLHCVIVLGMILAFVIGTLYMFRNQIAFAEKILTFALGMGSGYGIANVSKKKS
jgi:hypothetical protein